MLWIQNDYPSIIKKLTVCILPKYSEEYSLLVLLVSVYVNLSKNSLFALLIFGKRVQRYNYFPNLQNFLRKIFSFSSKKIVRLIFVKRTNRFHLYIYYSLGAWPIKSINSSSFGVMIIWVRRLRCLPTSVSLSAIGLYSPRPPAVRRFGSTP